MRARSARTERMIVIAPGMSMRARHDLVHVRLASPREARDRRPPAVRTARGPAAPGLEPRRLRQIRARELVAPLFAAPFEHVDDLAHLLILEQSTHELGARIFPLLFVAARQQQLRLDAQQPRGHLEILRRLVQSERANAARRTARRCARSECRRCRPALRESAKAADRAGRKTPSVSTTNPSRIRWYTASRASGA